MALLTRTRSKSGFSRRATADLKKKERKGRRRRRWEEMKGRCKYSSDNSVSACRWTRHCSSLNNIWRTHNVLVMSQEVDAVVTTQIQQSKKTTKKFCSVDKFLFFSLSFILCQEVDTVYKHKPARHAVWCHFTPKYQHSSQPIPRRHGMCGQCVEREKGGQNHNQKGHVYYIVHLFYTCYTTLADPAIRQRAACSQNHFLCPRRAS